MLPRYCPNRPLPARRFVPNRGLGRPGEERGDAGGTLPAEGPPDPAPPWHRDVVYLWGVDLYNHGFHWEAHEAWEGLWRAARAQSARQVFLRGLIQCAAAALTASIGRHAAARHHAARAIARLMRAENEAGPVYMGVPIQSFARQIHDALVAPERPRPAPVLRLASLPAAVKADPT